MIVVLMENPLNDTNKAITTEMDTIHNPSLNIVHYGLISMHSISVF